MSRTARDEITRQATEAMIAEGYAHDTIQTCLRWAARYRAYCGGGVDHAAVLTQQSAMAFARSYRRRHHARSGIVAEITSRLHVWSRILGTVGVKVPAWRPPCRTDGPFDNLLEEYRRYSRRVRGVRETSLPWTCLHITRFLTMLRRRRRPVSKTQIGDVDAFLVRYAQRVRPVAVAHACHSLRSFLRFLHATGRIPLDLAPMISGPRLPRKLPRALPWQDIRKILAAVDPSGVIGKRDYAILLLMVSYGLGAGEIAGMQIDNLDWAHQTMRVIRPKTRVEVVVPLVGPVARALSVYLKHARPSRALQSRSVFLAQRAPHRPLSVQGIRRLLRHAAIRAGVDARGLGAHVLRHSHATMQVQVASPPKVVSEILGHRSPSSLSTYVRVAPARLQGICLTVPR